MIESKNIHINKYLSIYFMYVYMRMPLHLHMYVYLGIGLHSMRPKTWICKSIACLLEIYTYIYIYIYICVCIGLQMLFDSGRAGGAAGRPAAGGSAHAKRRGVSFVLVSPFSFVLFVSFCVGFFACCGF